MTADPVTSPGMVAEIEARLSELERLRDDAKITGRLHAIGDTLAEDVGRCTCGSPLGLYPHEPYCGVEPVIMRVPPEVVPLLAAAVNGLPGAIKHARDVLARHRVRSCCPPEDRADCPWPDECVICGNDVEHFQPWPCPEITSLHAWLCRGETKERTDG